MELSEVLTHLATYMELCRGRKREKRYKEMVYNYGASLTQRNKW